MERSALKLAERNGDLPGPDALTAPASPDSLALVARGTTGPVTPEGKSVSRLNALKHGILAQLVPPAEADAYAAHAAAVLEHYAPDGYLEERLADRIASSLWRLARLERHEAAVVARDTDQALQAIDEREASLSARAARLPRTRGEIRGDRGDLADALELHRLGPDGLRALEGSDPGRLFDWAWGVRAVAYGYGPALDRAERAIGKALGLKRDEEWTELEPERWTYEAARAAVIALYRTRADGKDFDLPGGWEALEETLSVRLAHASLEVRELEQTEAHARALAGLPHTGTLEKVAKYEAHLERGLYKALHELEAMQARRSGEAAPLARLEVHGLE